MFTLSLLLLGAAPAEIPAFDRAKTMQHCVDDNEDSFDGQFECLRDEIEDHHQFMTLWQFDKPERQAGYRQCFNAKWDEDTDTPNWGRTIFCLENTADPKLEAEDSGGAFNLKTAQARCQAEKDTPTTTYPDGTKSGQDIEACMSDAALGHRSFRLIRTKLQKDRASEALKGVAYCEKTWVVKEQRNDWGMAIFCLNQQLSAPMLIQGLHALK